MRRFIVEEALTPGRRLRLTPEETRHALRALRLVEGDLILIADGKGNEGEGKIIGVAPEGAEIELLNVKTAEKLAALELLQAPLKGPKMDWLVEKATEMGVSAIRLARSQHTVATGEKIDRWRRVAQAAVKQSGSPRIPEIHAAASFAQALHDLPTDGLRVHLQPGAEKSLASVAKEGLAAGAARIILAVGPEGGFSPEEEKQLNAAGFVSVALSRQILRGETAALAALAIVAHCIDF